MKNTATITIKIIPEGSDLGGIRTLPIPAPVEEHVQQRQDESDKDFIARAGIALEFLRHRHNLPDTCEIVDAHHPDCECSTCKSGKDTLCGGPAVGTARMGEDSWRICEDHAQSADRDPEAEGVVTRDG